MDQREAATVVAALAAYYPRENVPDSTVVVWAQQLLPYRREDAMWAVEQIVKTSRRLPSLSDILDGIRSRNVDPGALPELPAPPPSRILDRIELRLSPSDDDLPYLEARGLQEQRNMAGAEFRQHRFTAPGKAKQVGAAAEWERVRERLGADATDRDIASEVHRREVERMHARKPEKHDDTVPTVKGSTDA